MHEKQIENLGALSSKDRYEHFLSKVCDWEELWILENEEGHFLIVCPDPENEYIPVWPHSEYAKLFGEDYPSCKPEKLDLSAFIEKWLPGLANDEIKVGVLPNLETTVWIINPLELKAELEAELSQYE